MKETGLELLVMHSVSGSLLWQGHFQEQQNTGVYLTKPFGHQSITCLNGLVLFDR